MRGKLGQADDLAIGDVGDVRAAEEGEHVVLAERIELDVAHHDHAAVRLAEHRVAHDIAHVHVVAAREPGERVRDALGRALESFALRVLADDLERSGARALELGVVRRARLEIEPPVLRRRFQRGGIHALAHGERTCGRLGLASLAARAVGESVGESVRELVRELVRGRDFLSAMWSRRSSG